MTRGKRMKCPACSQTYREGEGHAKARCLFNQAVGRPHKYGAVRETDETSGRSFASRLERDVFKILVLMETQGLIRELRCQAEVRLSDAHVIYKPDFQFWDCVEECEAWAEAKGIETDAWKIKLRLWRAYGPGPLQLWRAFPGGPRMTEIVKPKEKVEA